MKYSDVWTEGEEERVLHLLFTPPLLDPDVLEQRNIYRAKEKKITPSRTWTVQGLIQKMNGKVAKVVRSEIFG